MIPRLTLDLSWFDLMRGFQYCLGKSRPRYAELEQLWCEEGAVVHLSVRSLWDAYLSTRSWPKGSEVLMSAVTIPHMAEIVRAAGYIPVPIDLDLSTMEPSVELVKQRISEKTRAMIVAHLFGGFVDLTPFSLVCQEEAIDLIEDCAQAYNGTQFRGDLRATMSLFSFGTIKSATALGGGIATIRDPALRRVIQAKRDEAPYLQQHKYLFKILKYALIKRISTPRIFGSLFWLCDRLGIDFDGVLNASVRGFSGGQLFEKLRTQPPQAMLRLLQRRILQDRSKFYAERGVAARALFSSLPAQVTPLGIQSLQYTGWIIPVIAEQREELTAYLRAHGYDATYRASSMYAISAPEGFPDPNNAQTAFEEVLYLPIYPHLGVVGYQRLAQIICQFYQTRSENG